MTFPVKAALAILLLFGNKSILATAAWALQMIFQPGISLGLGVLMIRKLASRAERFLMFIEAW